MTLRRCLLVPLFVLIALLPFAGVSAAHSDPLEVVASGLDNPRGLDVGPWGRPVCGRGRSRRRWALCHRPRRAADLLGCHRCAHQDLARQAAPCAGGPALDGPHRRRRRHRPLGHLVRLLQCLHDGRPGPGPGGARRASVRSARGSESSTGSRPSAECARVADIAAYEAAANPDEGKRTAIPTRCSQRTARRYVVDAGGKRPAAGSAPRADPHTWRSSRSASCPRRPASPISQRDRDSDAGRADQRGSRSRPCSLRQPAHRLPVPRRRREHLSHRPPRTATPRSTKSGFTNVTDLAFGRDGSLYVVEFATKGRCSGDPTGAAQEGGARRDGRDDRERRPGEPLRRGGEPQGTHLRHEPRRGGRHRPGRSGGYRLIGGEWR